MRQVARQGTGRERRAVSQVHLSRVHKWFPRRLLKSISPASPRPPVIQLTYGAGRRFSANTILRFYDFTPAAVRRRRPLFEAANSAATCGTTRPELVAHNKWRPSGRAAPKTPAVESWIASGVHGRSRIVVNTILRRYAHSPDMAFQCCRKTAVGGFRRVRPFRRRISANTFLRFYAQ